MYATERYDAIERILQTDGRLAVLDLAQRFDVTTETVRRDLAELERRGVLTRVHGGAVAAERSSIRETAIGERIRENSRAKRDIAARAVAALGHGFTGSIFLDAGSTAAAVAAALPPYLTETAGHAHVVTHSLALAPALAEAGRIELSVVGGHIRGVTAAAVGATTVATIAGLRPDVAVVGTNGISSGFGLSTPDPEEAAVKSAIVASARRVIVVCDSTKFERELLVGFAPLDAVDVLVTDAAPPEPLATALAEAEVEVLVA
ncbi:DeoR/GlpR transcriptional regulator [Microbacterium caowuchunii]|uniref:DeoR/GlpR family DNA-binding transcription regulator n=1 Tax=Microbacterium caowuchunii TaxID=2614638 RepID=UPI0012469832|nr:DeoR/GlpR family DNA-binding transcription regulator [Microbacterium caowuchunii]QEV99774.1 DeoR/GlpR transcriptional regulator [Microbacterium caowuchunii]